MNYIYDILVNFNEKLYEFYDWNVTDEIEHIRKMPIYKISSEDLIKLKKNEFIIDKNILQDIHNKTEVFQNKSSIIIEYSSLFTDGLEVLGFEFTSDGKVLYKTNLLVDEEIDVLDVALSLEEKKLEYIILKPIQIYDFKTRNEVIILDYINKEIKKLTNNNFEKLKYLYYECFNERAEDKNLIIKKIYFELETNWDSTYPLVYDFFKLTKVKH